MGKNQQTIEKEFEWKKPELVVGQEYDIGDTMVPYVYLGDVRGNSRLGLGGSLQDVRELTIHRTQIRMFGDYQIKNEDSEFKFRRLHYAEVDYVPKEERDEALVLLRELNEARGQTGERI